MNQVVSIKPKPPFIEDNDEDEFELFDDDPELVPNGLSQSLEYTRAKSVCFWHPEGVTEPVAVPMEFVGECNRYEQQK